MEQQIHLKNLELRFSMSLSLLSLFLLSLVFSVIITIIITLPLLSSFHCCSQGSQLSCPCPASCSRQWTCPVGHWYVHTAGASALAPGSVTRWCYPPLSWSLCHGRRQGPDTLSLRKTQQQSRDWVVLIISGYISSNALKTARKICRYLQ